MKAAGPALGNVFRLELVAWSDPSRGAGRTVMPECWHWRLVYCMSDADDPSIGQYEGTDEFVYGIISRWLSPSYIIYSAAESLEAIEI